jgi:hypothetical protein
MTSGAERPNSNTKLLSRLKHTMITILQGIAAFITISESLLLLALFVCIMFLFNRSIELACSP